MSADDRRVPIDENAVEVAGWLAGLAPEMMDMEASKIAKALYLVMRDIGPGRCRFESAAMVLNTIAGGLALARSQATMRATTAGL